MLRNYLYLIVIVVSVAVRASLQNSGSGAKNVTLQTDGRFTEFALPHANSGPTTITVTRDGTVWFTEGTGNRSGGTSGSPSKIRLGV